MSFYGGLAKTAEKLIAEKGRSVILRHSGSAYDPITDTTTGGTTDTPVKVVFSSFKQTEIDGTLILRTDKKVLLAASAMATEPQGNDVLVDGANQYRVIDIMAVQPGETKTLFTLQVRK
jgi:hypothetical protein